MGYFNLFSTFSAHVKRLIVPLKIIVSLCVRRCDSGNA